MKNFNRENGFQWVTLLVFCFMLASVTAVTGCSTDSNKKGKSKTTTTDDSARRSSSDSDGNTDRLTRARNISQYNYVSQGAVDFGFDLYTANGQDADAYYAGSVEVEGYLDYRGSDFRECGFTEGYWEIKENLTDGYYVTDLAGGGFNFMNWQGARFIAKNKSDNREATIVIPSQNGYYLFPGIEVEDAPETIGEDGIRYSSTFWGEIIIESVEGIPCAVGYELLSFIFIQGSSPQP